MASSSCQNKVETPTTSSRAPSPLYLADSRPLHLLFILPETPFPCSQCWLLFKLQLVTSESTLTTDPPRPPSSISPPEPLSPPGITSVVCIWRLSTPAPALRGVWRLAVWSPPWLLSCHTVGSQCRSVNLVNTRRQPCALSDPCRQGRGLQAQARRNTAGWWQPQPGGSGQAWRWETRGGHSSPARH